ncbi:MAG TPA: hypothetical protein VI670_27935 [Thermoanaerobaculia bacterium]|jgi:hypothetical protein
MKTIRVTFDSHTPDEWNTPVPVEVFDDAMRRVGQPQVLDLGNGGTIDVDREGRYYVFATLPTGESIGVNVEVAATGAKPADAVLMRAESSPWESVAWAFTGQRAPRPQETSRGSVLPGPFEVTGPRFDLGIDLREEARRTAPAPMLDVLSLTNRKGKWSLRPASDEWVWDSTVRDADPRLMGRLAIKRLPPTSSTLTETRWYPLFVRHRAFSRPESPISTLIAVPAGQRFGYDPGQESIVLFTRRDSVPAGASPVQTLVRGARTQAETLLSYFENGVFTAARQLSAKVVRDAFSLLEDKREDPFGAAIAGYVLLRTNASREDERERQSWMLNLANWFPLIPDGAVIYGASLLHGENGEDPTRLNEARSFLLKAVSRGIPTYTMGLRLLFDTLRSLAEEREDDAELATALARVRAVAAYADWTAQTTTLTYSDRALVESAIEIPE